MNKYEQLVEFIINDESDKARELFHQIVVEKSRDIYESLVAEEDLEETMGGNEVEELVDEVTLDEEGISEEEDEDLEDAPDFGSEEGEEFDHHADVGGEEELEDRVMDLEDALDELKAEFDSLMAGEESEEEQFPGIHGDDEMGDEELPEEMYEAESCDEDEDEEELDETIVREYVEKVGETNQKSEGGEVGAGKSASINTKSTVAGKNDMGGSAVTSKGGNQDQNGNRPAATEKPKGTLVSNPQNKPGANAGKTAFKSKETAKAGETSVNAKSPVAR